MLPRSNTTYFLTVTVSSPLWTMGRIRAEEAKADLQIRQLAIEERAERDSIAEEETSDRADLELARHQAGVARYGLGRPRRYTAGVKPIRRLNMLVSRLCVPNPASTAISASG